jgi:Tfp pilus assembly protein PilZ
MRPERRRTRLLRVPFVQACTIHLTQGGGVLPGFIVNINTLGAYVAAEKGESPALGAAVVCRFRIPENTIELSVRGTVAWVNPYQEHPVHSLPSGFGVKFDTLPEEHARRIQRIVDDYAERRPELR